jgi:hypothetical protein
MVVIAIKGQTVGGYEIGFTAVLPSVFGANVVERDGFLQVLRVCDFNMVFVNTVGGVSASVAAPDIKPCPHTLRPRFQ